MGGTTVSGGVLDSTEPIIQALSVNIIGYYN